jgi:hypothetical protein
MRCLSSPVLILALCSLLSAQEPQPANGGFEQLDPKTGLPAGWSTWHTPNLCAYTLATAHSGVAAAGVTDDNATDSQGLRSPRVAITGGKTYLATGYTWITQLQAGAFSLYLEFWRGDERVANYAVSTGESGRWVELKVQQTAPAEATEATVLIYGSSATIGHAYFDDVSLTVQ